MAKFYQKYYTKWHKHIKIFGLHFRFRDNKGAIEELTNRLEFLESGVHSLKPKPESVKPTPPKPVIFIPDKNIQRRDHRNIRNHDFFNITDTGLEAAFALNKIKEIELERKVRDGKKVRVCFLLDDISRIPWLSVYKSMQKSDLFEPFIFVWCGRVISIKDTKKKEVEIHKYKKSLEFFKNEGFEIVEGLDKNLHSVELSNSKPDIVFYSAPYLSNDQVDINNAYLNSNYLTCYLDYGMLTTSLYNYQFGNKQIASCWKHFTDNFLSLQEHRINSLYSGINCINLGNPKLDDYAKPSLNFKGIEKFDRSRPLIIWAPHWTICDIDFALGTFHLYWEYFLNLIKQHPQYNFIFKPHPVLFYSIINQMKRSVDWWNEFRRDLDSLPNCAVIESGDYIELFKQADLLITDSGSFIGEWMPTLKPCMYLINPTIKPYIQNRFSDFGLKCLSSYYLCHSLDDIKENFNKLLVEKKDEKAELRKQLVDELFTNIGTAGEKITEYLENILKD